jgi:hypothetical protein
MARFSSSRESGSSIQSPPSISGTSTLSSRYAKRVRTGLSRATPGAAMKPCVLAASYNQCCEMVFFIYGSRFGSGLYKKNLDLDSEAPKKYARKMQKNM